MFNIKYLISVPYTTEQMFYLVNDITSYVQFIPGCVASSILKKSNNELIAKMNLSVSGLTKSLITHNYFIKNKIIVICLVRGPFKSFYGYWKFIPITQSVSQIEYSCKCEFNSTLTEMIFNYSFKKINRDMIQAFIHRAQKIYDV